MQYNNDFAGLLEARNAVRDTQRENSARLGKSHLFWTTTGTGEFLVKTAFYFDCVFAEKPHFTYGAEVSDGQDLIAKRYPRTFAGVYEWVRARPPGNLDGDPGDIPADDIMFYTGAYIYFVVDILGFGLTFSAPQPSYTVIHHLAFEGVAIKDVPAYLIP